MLGSKVIENPKVQKAIVVLKDNSFDVKEISDLLDMGDTEIWAFLRSKGKLAKAV
jgi:phage antirepressor YoqD-like protein